MTKTDELRLRDIGEKRLISEYLLPLLNPDRDRFGIGDDCGFVMLEAAEVTVCLSTDRVPADLISYKLGLISDEQLGYYLGVLNLSDLAACGAKPSGLMLNIAVPPAHSLTSFMDIVRGARRAAEDYDCHILGGDLSTSVETSLVATVVGIAPTRTLLLRRGARVGDVVFCSDTVGLTPTAFQHFLADDATRSQLSRRNELALADCFRSPMARIALGQRLAALGVCSSVMDNTDGLAQSLAELAALNDVCIAIDGDALPISPISVEVAKNTGVDVLELVLGPGADFQLVGTARTGKPLPEVLRKIGEVREGSGLILGRAGSDEAFEAKGWNYFSATP